MAAALLDRAAHGRVRVLSAGTAPAATIHAGVQEAMGEVGIDLSNEVPKQLDPDSIRAIDVVVTMGCGDSCPVFPGTRYVDWDLPDPAGKSVTEVRPIRDDIDSRVRRLLNDLLPGGFGR
jgi:arsenate reductase (thioredoxin)